jgi:hypothetical protein
MVNPNQRSERRGLRVWRRLRGWFRNLSNPKKVASVAGGVATTLAIITGLITVGEKINSVVRAGGEAKTEVNVPTGNVPTGPRYDRSEVQEAIEKQQEAVQEYAFPYTPPEQLKTSGEDRVAGSGEQSEEPHPIRADYTYFGQYNEGVIMEGFDPARDSANQLREGWQLKSGPVALSYPWVWVSVTSLVEDENVILSPYLVIEITDVRQMPERVDYVVSPSGGGGGTTRLFEAMLSPEREGVLYAPQRMSETERGSGPTNAKTYPFFTLEYGEVEVLLLFITMLPDYFYHFRVGVQYSYKGRQGVDWSEEEFVAGVPLEAEVWMAGSQGTSRLRKFGDLQEYNDRTIVENGIRTTPAT